jgi:hypothetical protein
MQFDIEVEEVVCTPKVITIEAPTAEEAWARVKTGSHPQDEQELGTTFRAVHGLPVPDAEPRMLGRIPLRILGETPT